VDAFNESPDIPIFLLSLKAGGTGLNLATADTVIHLDPWWNPAVEAQATDRAHRIGQTRIVTSYKLIAAGTVEERVLNLQQEKRAMLADVFEESDAANAALTLADLKSLVAAD
jgi:SNF2 family DNA or RNA helicase